MQVERDGGVVTVTLSAEAQAQAINLASGDIAEAIAAFIERREPSFEGH